LQQRRTGSIDQRHAMPGDRGAGLFATGIHHHDDRCTIFTASGKGKNSIVHWAGGTVHPERLNLKSIQCREFFSKADEFSYGLKVFIRLVSF